MTDARTGAVPPKVLRPRDAATLIIVDMAGGEPRVLLGRRRADLAFMPGRYVFPGGRVDPADRQIAVEHDLEPGNIKNLMVAMKGNRSPATGARPGAGRRARDLRGGGPADRRARAGRHRRPRRRPGSSSSPTAIVRR